MVNQKDKQKMRDFVSQQILDAGRFDITDVYKKGILISQKKELVEDPKTMFVYLHDSKTPLHTYDAHVAQILENHDYISNIFYKNDKDFMVRLGSSGTGRSGKSLKLYTRDEINNMISLRGLEKKVLNKQWNNNSLVYYQPQTAQLQESLREYNMQNVDLDYSHLDSTTFAGSYSQDGVSEDYKLAQEIVTPNEKLTFKGTPDMLSIVPKR